MKKNKTIIKWVVAAAVLILTVYGITILIKRAPKNGSDENEIISREGLHFHSELLIFIKGEKQIIPKDVGIGITHNPMHSHEEDGIIHMEFNGVVRKNDLKLGNFFKVWKKQFSVNCIFEFCNNNEGKIKMFVNGAENHDFENYIMKDSDKIEIRFE